MHLKIQSVLPGLLFVGFLFSPLILIGTPPDDEAEQVILVPVESEPAPVDTTLFFVVDKPAGFPGGIDSMKCFIEGNIRIPALYRDVSVEGRVVVGFTVEKDGRLTDLALLRSVDPILDSCALDLIRMMPRWEPALHGGDTVRSRFIMPVRVSW